MKIEKKLISLSIIALVFGIIAILPIIVYAPAPIEPQPILMSADEVFGINNVTLVAVPVTPTEDISVLVYTLIPADEFFATYGGNTTIPYIPYLTPTPNPGDR
jgi:hypothetical protein